MGLVRVAVVNFILLETTRWFPQDFPKLQFVGEMFFDFFAYFLVSDVLLNVFDFLPPDIDLVLDEFSIVTVERQESFFIFIL